jgi:hypothetical protein
MCQLSLWGPILIGILLFYILHFYYRYIYECALSMRRRCIIIMPYMVTTHEDVFEEIIIDSTFLDNTCLKAYMIN